MQNGAELAAIVAEFAAGGALPLVDAEPSGIGIITDMAGLNDDEVLAMMRMRPVPVDGDLAADAAMVDSPGFRPSRTRARASSGYARSPGIDSNYTAVARNGCTASPGRQASGLR